MGFFFLRSRSVKDSSLEAAFEKIRLKFKMPALSGALFSTESIIEKATVGVRKMGTDVAATPNDLWHLGSDGKAMTAVLAGTFVAEGKIAWDQKICPFFPEIADKGPLTMRDVTFADLLHHRAGLTENLKWRNLCQEDGEITGQRALAAKQALLSPAYKPGTFHYANTSYVVASAILEKISGRSWEELMRERVFAPLGMTSAGFGGTGTPGQIDQPWPHIQGAKFTLLNGPTIDNPPIMGPAGCIHCSIDDWARFLIDQLRGSAGLPGKFPASIYQAMQTPAPGGEYGFGWIIVKRPWAGGRALTHTGSNTMNYAVCWLAPAKKFGVLVCTNQGHAGFEACDAAATVMIQRFEKMK